MREHGYGQYGQVIPTRNPEPSGEEPTDNGQPENTLPQYSRQVGRSRGRNVLANPRHLPAAESGRKPTPVEESIANLDSALMRLSDELSLLESRLDPALGPDMSDATQTDDRDDEIAQSALVYRINVLTEAVWRESNRVTTLISRVEL